MNAPEPTVIDLNKSRLLLLVLTSIIFVAIGVWMLSLDNVAILSLRRLRDITIFQGIAVVSIAFFGACGALLFFKLFDNRPGLIFSAEGILDNSSAVAAGFIPWTDIQSARTIIKSRQNFLLIEVNDPQKYVSREKWAKRILINTNRKTYGSPIIIPTITLRSNSSDLLSLFNKYQKLHGNTVT